MTQADSVHSTPPANTSVRRSRRSILGAIAAGGTVAALAVTIPGPVDAADRPDPIYAVIEAHRRACSDHHEAVDIHMAFEEVGMEGEKLEKYYSLGAETKAAYDRMDNVGCDLINTKPATLCRHSCGLPIYQTTIRGGRFARLAGVYFV